MHTSILLKIQITRVMTKTEDKNFSKILIPTFLLINF